MYKSQKSLQVKQHCYAVSEAAPTQMKIYVRNKTAAPKDFAFICGLSGRTSWFQVFSAHLRRCAAVPPGLFLERQFQIFLDRLENLPHYQTLRLEQKQFP